MSKKQKLRGKELENRVNKTNLRYRLDKLAIIYNLPLPVKVTKDGVIPMTSPTDYMGTIGPKGKSVTFDAKETSCKTRFDLANIHDHQINYLYLSEVVGAKSGFLIWFKKMRADQAFFTPASFVKNFMETSKRSSIPYKDFKKEWLVEIDDYLNLYNNDE